MSWNPLTAHNSELRTQNSELRTSMSLLRLCEWPRGHSWKHRAPRIPLFISRRFVGSRSDVVLVCRDRSDDRPAFDGPDDAARAVFGGHSAPSPWTTAGFLLMIGSGALLFYAAQLVRYQNIFFRVKMAALMLAALNVFVFHNTVDRRRTEWDSDPVPPRGARWGGGVALVLWAVLIVLGRMIPYQVYWFDCNKQPQPAILNWLAGCASASP